MNEPLRRLIKWIFFMRPVFFSYEFLSWNVHRRNIANQYGRLRLHIGAGDRILDKWVNIDVYPGRNLLTMRLPKGLRKFSDQSVRYIYASHFLEHLSHPQEATEFLQHCYRILIPGGAIRVIVPDVRQIIRAYMADDEEFFSFQAELHPSWCTTKFEHLMYALQQDGEHKYGYDFETVEKLLSQAGFREIQRSDYHKSRINDLNIDYRTETDHTGKSLHLYVEAIKKDNTH